MNPVYTHDSFKTTYSAVNWGSSIQAHTYTSALRKMLHLVYTEEHVKNYRPSVVLFSGNPVARAGLVDFFSCMTKDTSLLVCGDVVVVSDRFKFLLNLSPKEEYDWAQGMGHINYTCMLKSLVNAFLID